MLDTWINKGIPVLFQGSLGSTKRLVWRVFDVEFSITNYLFWIWVVRVGRSWLIYLQRESDLLIRVSYHTQTAFEKHERAPERLPWNRNVLPLCPMNQILRLYSFRDEFRGIWITVSNQAVSMMQDSMQDLMQQSELVHESTRLMTSHKLEWSEEKLPQWQLIDSFYTNMIICT